MLSVTTDANGDATWTFDPALDVTQPASFTFTATVTDKDGDVDTDTHTISITDGADPTTSGSLTLIVDEKDLSDGTTALLNTGGEGGNPDTVDVDTGTLSFTAGSDRSPTSGSAMPWASLSRVWMKLFWRRSAGPAWARTR